MACVLRRRTKLENGMIHSVVRMIHIQRGSHDPTGLYLTHVMIKQWQRLNRIAITSGHKGHGIIESVEFEWLMGDVCT